MPSIYCPHCGSPNQYSFQKPADCLHCRKSFNVFTPKEVTTASIATLPTPAPRAPEKAASTIIKQKRRFPSRREVESEDIEEPYLEGELEIPSVIEVPEEPEVVIHVNRPNAVKAGDIIGTGGSNGNIDTARRGPGRPRTSKKGAMKRLEDFNAGIFTRTIHDES